MAQKTQRSLSSGELAPELHVRADVARYHSGLAVCQNFFLLVRGGAANRPGFQFIAEVKDHAVKHRLVDFAYNSQQTYVLVFGDQNMRVIKDGGQVLLPSAPAAWVVSTAYTKGQHRANGGTNYYCYATHTSSAADEPGVGANWTDYWHPLTGDIVEINTVYTEAQLPAVDYTQLGDVVTLAQQQQPVQELIRYDHHDWRIANKSFDVTIDPPAGTPTVTATPGVTAASTLYEYLVRAVDATGDSPDSAVVSCTNVSKSSLAGSGANYNSISWNSVAGATSYDIYIKDGGTWYLLTSTTATSYVDQDAARTTTTKAASTGTPAAPTGVSAVATNSSGRNYQYKITAVSEDGEESVASTAGAVFNRDPFQEGDYNQVSWSTVAGALEYRVYKEYNGLFGYAGTTKAATWRDDNIQPDLSRTPPEARNPFSGAGNYPGAVEYFEQRQVFARTINEPRTVWTTRSGLHNNMTVSTPAQDDNAMTFSIASRRANEIYYLVPLASLLAVADRGNLSIRGQDGYLTPKQPPQINKQGTRGSYPLAPLEIDDSVLFVEGTGRAIYDLFYETTVDGFTSGLQVNDRTVLSQHLLETYGIIDWCYAQHPHNLVWAVRSDGVLLSLTYHREHDVYGWARHSTDGQFEAIASVREGAEDAVYVVVKRTIGGQTKRYIERLHSREFTDIADAFFVDSGLTYSGSATTTISGLGHLEGKQVAILADGNKHAPRTVSGGQITLDYAASKVHVGLAYDCDLETLDIDSNESGIRGRIIDVHSVTLSLLKTRGGWIGPTADTATMHEIRRDEDLFTGDHRQGLHSGGFADSNGRVHIRQSSPLPMTVLAVTPRYRYSDIE